jgi:hypothetical protein
MDCERNEESGWEKIQVGVFHETMGPMEKWPRSVESARWGLSDHLRGKIINKDKGHRYAYWRWKQWVLVAGYRNDFKESRDTIICEGIPEMIKVSGVRSSMIGVQKLNSAKGKALLHRVKTKWQCTNTPPDHIMGLRLPEVEYDDIAFDDGGTFGLRCNIAVPPDGDDMTYEQKIEYMVTMTKIKIYTMERLDEETHDTRKAILRFGLPRDAYCWMDREEGDSCIFPELHESIGECSNRKMTIEFLKEDGSSSKFLTGVSALETLMDRLMIRMTEAVKETRWTEIEQPDSLMDCIEGSIEEEFTTQYCLISGIGQKQIMLGQGNGANLDKMVTAVAGLDSMEFETG